MVQFQFKLHLLVPGKVSPVWSGGAGLVRPALPLGPHLQSAHWLYPTPPPPLAGRLPYRFRVWPVSRVPGGSSWGFVCIAVTEELAEVVNRAEIHPCCSGPQQNLHHPWVTTQYCTGRDTLSPYNSFLIAWAATNGSSQIKLLKSYLGTSLLVYAETTVCFYTSKDFINDLEYFHDFSMFFNFFEDKFKCLSS